LREFSWRRLRKLFLFAAVPALGIVSPLLVIPAVTAKFGADGWAAIAIGMSAGAAASVLVELGWGLTGPQQIAGLQTHDRAHIFALSLITKLTILIPVAPLLILLCLAITPNNTMEAALMGLASAAVGLSPAWFFVGTSQPYRILITDSFPKLAAAAVTSVVLLTGGPLAAYPTLFLIAAIISPLLGAWMSDVSRRSMIGINVSMVWQTMRRQSIALIGRAASSLYLSLPTTILAITSPAAVAQFAAADRLQRMLLSGLSSVPNSLQGWIGSSETNDIRMRRVRLALILNGAMGAVAGFCFAMFGPFLASLVFSGEVPLSFGLSAACGFIIFLTCTSRATGGLALIALKRVGWLTTSALVGAGLGFSLILWLGGAFGAVGALTAMAVAEGCVLIVQLGAVAYYSTKPPRGGHP
jgi:O-antigen/teichoic acid export membrane protein